MSRARYNEQIRQTAAANETSNASGCLSLFLLPPFAVLVVGALLAVFAFNSSAQAVLAKANSPTIGTISPIFTPEVQRWDSSILRWATASSLDPNLVAVIMQIESCGNPFARSSAGAMGLFQVMPYHFLASDDPYDPDTNAARGLDYLRRSLAASNNNVRLALAGYNGGISVISSGEWFWAAETSRYVYWGSGIYEDTLTGATQSARLNEWLRAGGASLCNKAKQQLGMSG
ncbi:MAG: transglycosylase SLT domain-containing protein [Chloroflexi bacterium]|nr:transglycosylase SLT domain-containing protein [Chloroflexota bacterium]